MTSVSGQVGAESGLSDARDNLGTIDQFIANKKSLFAITGQKKDIFGRSQDPKKAAVEQRAKEVTAVKPKASIPLQQILDALPVTMIDPLGDRVVLTGSPPISKGETLELAFQGQTVMLRFEGARSTGAYFREMKSKKLGLRKMTRLPKGIKSGNQKMEIAEGVHHLIPNKPQNIKLDLNLGGSSRPN